MQLQRPCSELGSVDKATNAFMHPLLSQELALDAVATVSVLNDSSRVEVDIKNYARIEKIAGGQIEESKVLKGVCQL